jgi:hypothetical protein
MGDFASHVKLTDAVGVVFGPGFVNRSGKLRFSGGWKSRSEDGCHQDYEEGLEWEFGSHTAVQQEGGGLVEF